MKVSVYPNPFTQELSLEVSVDLKESVIVCVLDHQQSIVRMLSWPLQKGKNKAAVNDVAPLPPGEYTVTISNAAGRNVFHTKVEKAEP
ncbi:MAG: hypothetical protein INR73_26415 [Williamsia sp.]|nr:hypothetical protein [Williamsia sp.]